MSHLRKVSTGGKGGPWKDRTKVLLYTLGCILIVNRSTNIFLNPFMTEIPIIYKLVR